MNGYSYRLKHSKRRVCDDQPPQESGQNCSARCATTLDIPCNSEGEIPLALPLPEVKPRFPQPLKLMHFHSGPLMYFCSGVDTHALIDSKNSAAAATLRIVLVPFSFICSPCEDFREGRGSFDSFLRLPTRPNV